MADDPNDYSRHFPKAYKEAQGMKRQLKFNDWLLGGTGLSNAREWVRPVGPDDTVHQREEPDTSGTYRRGGSVRRYAGGGAIDTGSVNHFDTGGVSPMPAFGYDPTAYTTQAISNANALTDRGNDMYNWASGLSNTNEGTANQVIGSALKNGSMFDDAAAAGLSRYQSMYGPAMAQHLQFAQNFGSPAEVEAARGRGIAGVGQAYDAQTAAAADALRDNGLDPKAIASRLDSGVRTQRAAAGVAQGNTDALNRQVAGETMLGQSIGLGQADANLTNQFAGMGAADRNQAVNTGNATLQTGTIAKSAALPYSVAGNTELAQWPKAELDAMHASNEQGALWNDINRTNISNTQVANAAGSGAGAIAGGLLGAASNMFKFSPITLAHGGMIPHAAAGGSTWRKFAYGDPIGVPEPIEDTAVKTGDQPGFASGLKAGQGKGGNQPFEFQWPTSGGTSPPQPTDSGTWAGNVQAAPSAGTGLQGQYAPEDFMPGGQFADTMGAGWGAKRGGMIPHATGGGALHDIVHTVAPMANMIFPGLGILAQGAGDAITDTISGQTDQIGPDEASDFTLGADKNGQWGLPNLPGLGGLGKSLGIGGGGGGGGVAGSAGTDAATWGDAGSAATDAGSWGADAGDLSSLSGIGFARGGQIPMGPLGHLAHFIGGGAAGPYNSAAPVLQAPVSGPPGGAIQTGNIVPASAQVPGIKGPDNVPAMVSEGEGILPREVMEFIGKKGLKQIIDGAYKQMGQKPHPIGPEQGPTPQAAIKTGPTFMSPGAAQGASV